MLKGLKNIVISGIAGIAALAAVSAASNAAPIIPVGVQHDVALTTVTNTWGWNQIYRGDYRDGGIGGAGLSLSTVFNGVGTHVMIGAIQDGSNTIKLLAATSWAVLSTHTTRNQTITDNGAEWYNNAFSLGFAGLGDSITQNSADTSNVNAANRLSWHTTNTTLGRNPNNPSEALWGGYRAGATNGLNYSTGWDRIVFTANISDVPEPAGMAVLGLGLVGLGLIKRRRKAA